MEDEDDLDAILDQALAGADAGGTRLTNNQISDALDFDHQLALGSNRWRENDDGLLFQPNAQFVPGDVVAFRSTAVRRLAQLTALERIDIPNRAMLVARTAKLTHLAYSARPFWLPQATAWAMMATKPLNDEDRAELLLPCPALITFSSPMEITAPYVGIDLDVIERLERSYDLDPASTDLPSEKARDYPPINLRTGTLEILRFYRKLTGPDPDQAEPLFGYQLIGLIVAPAADGTLSNAVVWLLRKINPNIGATTRQVVQGLGLTTTAGSGTFSLVEGRLDRSLLQPIAEALAAVVAWGSWTAPDPYPDEIDRGRGFRKQSRTSAFKKAETRGQIAGIHVLAAREPAVRYTNQANPTGRTVAPHYRVGHWQRYRVGGRDNWTYERRRKHPVIVNATGDDLENRVRIYRLPPPHQS